MGALLKGVLFDLRARNLEKAKISLRAHYVHARHRVRNLSSLKLIAYQIQGTQVT